MKRILIIPQYVDYIPERLNEGVLYICEQYNIASHLCCCGCGKEVVTPLSPVDWVIKKNEDKVSLHPSIGNWSFPCQSHYYIQSNNIIWAEGFTQQQIAEVKKRDMTDKVKHIAYQNQQKRKQQSNNFKSIGNLLHSIWLSVVRIFK